MDRWSEWDPHEEASRCFGEFTVGTRAFSKPRGGPKANWILTEVSEPGSWALENSMPIGTLKVKNTYVQSEAGKVHCTRTM
ncbi:MAG: hypothetical protein AAFQ82_13730, partial [Myxococcota bacterium]